ncbi:copper chaperone PCu(A)C [Planosporangium mesophilum]|uniref:Copper chaperone PCu(A)C n=1 Tax=Planosporangium mesophilum TaxID=689768 RepID=A0A8J3X3B4_9ACTN|nr:copper chaperone PCu(A)C [Planosporangium mesophilum]NJC83645.1 copper chaperone PCu(A)C [Planosporangium mesophilum]GII25309.1 hypothetical protein Pme01_49060 [Planosporangium mesophilum]
MPRSITGTPSRRRTSRVAALLAAPAAAICLLSGCSAGQVDQTSRMSATVPGVDVTSKHGIAALRDVQIKYNNPQGYPVGATAPLSLYIANNNPGKALVLRSVTAVSRTNGAKVGTVVLTGGVPEIGALPAATPSSRTASALPSVPPTGRASTAPAAGAAAPSAGAAAPSAGAAAPSAGAAAPSAGAASAAPAPAAPSPSSAGGAPTLTIPANGYARLTPEAGSHLAIVGITEPLAPGSSVVVTFTFEGEDPVETRVPFGVPLSPVPRIEPSTEAHSEPGGH